MKLGWVVAAAVLGIPSAAAAQQAAILGTWKFDLEQSDAGGVMHILQHYESAGAWRWPFDLTGTAARAAWQPAE